MKWLWLIAAARAAPPLVEEAQFSHSRHTAEVACASCHATDTPTAAPEGGAPCHDCHPTTGWGPHWPGQRRGRCERCHATIPQPEDHGASWRARHGQEARFQTQTCSNCHAQRFCVDCHERKESIRFKVHDRTWLTVHGIEARTTPAQCSTCHLQADCVSCHATADGRRP